MSHWEGGVGKVQKSVTDYLNDPLASQKIHVFSYLRQERFNNIVTQVNEILFNDVINQGSPTQIHRGATFGLKMPSLATDLNMKDSAGLNAEYDIFSPKLATFEHFLSFNDRNF